MQIIFFYIFMKSSLLYSNLFLSCRFFLLRIIFIDRFEETEMKVTVL